RRCARIRPGGAAAGSKRGDQVCVQGLAASSRGGEAVRVEERCLMPEMTLIDAVREAPQEEMARDPSVIVLGEDVGRHGGVFRAPFGAGVHAGLYHSQSVEALFYHVPGLKIVVPSTPYDCKGLLKAAVRDDDPVLFFEHKKSYRRVNGEVPAEDYVLPIGKAEV